MSEAIRILGELRGGLVALQLSQEQEKLITACQATGKKGTLTISLEFQPVGSGNREMHIKSKISAKIPTDPGLEERSIFYAERGQLHRHDPNQGDLYRGPRSADTGVADGSSPAEQAERESKRFGS